jgi:hypothetical protein
MRGFLAQDFLLADLSILFRTVACSAFVSITVARQQGNLTPFRFFIPGLLINILIVVFLKYTC